MANKQPKMPGTAQKRKPGKPSPLPARALRNRKGGIGPKRKRK